MHTQTRHRPTSIGKRILLLLLAALFIAPQVAHAQATDTSAEVTTDVASVLEAGKQLEASQQWLEALGHYENAVRQHPHNPQLKQRHTLSRIHCDLDRRQVDPTYYQTVTSLDQHQAQEMFNEIALKVQTHYVDQPDWQQVTWRGTANLDIAVTKEAFQQRFLPTVSDAVINQFRHRLRSDVNTRAVQSREDARNLVAYTSRLAQQDLGLAPSAAMLEYCCGAISALDPYSSYLTGNQLDDVYSQIEGNFVGLGVELKADRNSLLIVKVIPGGPAERAGIRGGDRIVAVDGQSTNSVTSEEAAELLKGEPHSVVSVTLAAPDGGQRVVSVRRERVEVPSVEHAHMIDAQNGIAYFRLATFQKSTSRDVDTALWQLHRQGMRSLIVDLRGNPGGLLTASVDVSDKFLTDGKIVSTVGRSPRENFDYRAHRAGTWRVPLVVLIDGDSASASEIFAGAIRDQSRGTVVGQRSYGKGSVQGIFPLTTSHAGIRLTTAKFFSPNGQPISDRGVTPHRVVHVTARPTWTSSEVPTADKDESVAAAIETARQLVVANR